MKNIVVICITAVICMIIVAFPFYYQTFAAEDEAPAPVVVTEEAAATSRYTSIGEFDSYSDFKLVVDQDTGKVYVIQKSGATECTITYAGKIG
jgi:hypothetical protein